MPEKIKKTRKPGFAGGSIDLLPRNTITEYRNQPHLPKNPPPYFTPIFTAIIDMLPTAKFTLARSRS